MSASPSCLYSAADLMLGHFKAPLSLVGDVSSLRGSASARRLDLRDALDCPRSLTNYYPSADSIAVISDFFGAQHWPVLAYLLSDC